ncbi:MAG: sensor histidine kinase [Lachnospiraceae bacterium]|nr:sensor histidine kinase [Lachnospiraceae bacterium]
MKSIKYLRSHLLWKMFFWFVLLLLLPCLLLIGIYAAANDYHYTRETDKLERAALSQCANSIEQDMVSCTELFWMIQRHSNFLRFLNGGYPTVALQLEAYVKEFYNLFSYAKSFSPYIEKVQIYALRPDLLEIDDNVMYIDQLGTYSLDKETTYGYWRYEPETDRFIYRKLVNSLYDSTALGVLEIICHPSLLCDKLSPISESVSRQMYVVYDDSAYFLEDSCLVPGPLPKTRDGDLCQSLVSLPMELRAGQYLPRTDQRPVNWLSLLAMAGFTVIIACSILFFFSIYRLSRRIINFSKYISSAFTQLPGTYTDSCHDELGLVVKNFNQMLEQNNDLINQIKLEKLRQNEMAYRVLQAQIDPHFIYNALESMRMMAEMHDDPEVANVIFSFSKLMRYSLSANTAPATVEYELDIVSQYLQVQKIRLGDQLEYEIHCPESLHSLDCPQFVLQPLVENAIKYGRCQERPGIFVTIRLSMEEGLLTAVVENNGAELAPDKRMEINRRLAMGQDLSDLSSGTGVGLDSINNRMRYLYPESFQMELRPFPGQGLQVILIWRPAARGKGD